MLFCKRAVNTNLNVYQTEMSVKCVGLMKWLSIDKAVLTISAIFCELLLNVQKWIRIQDTAPTQVAHRCTITVTVTDNHPRNWRYERSEKLFVTNDVHVFFFVDLPVLMFFRMLIRMFVVSIYGRL
jgi:hypothetical protein